MINKLTIEEQWKQNPNKIYYVIQNPRISESKKKLVGLQIKIIEYAVQNFYFTSDVIYFKKIDETKNKRFPTLIKFDKRYPDAENEVFAAIDNLTKKKSLRDVDSYAIFNENRLANVHKLIRIHRLAEHISGSYNHLKSKAQIKKENVEEHNTDLEQLKKYFDEIQNTNYFEQLEKIQSEFPDLSVM
jgi:hypothetical protein